MTREEFLNRYFDETVGLLLAAFSSSSDSPTARKDEAPLAYATAGLFFIAQQRRARDLLTRMWESMHSAVGPADKVSPKGKNHEHQTHPVRTAG